MEVRKRWQVFNSFVVGITPKEAMNSQWIITKMGKNNSELWAISVMKIDATILNKTLGSET